MQALRRELDIDYIENDAPSLIQESREGIHRVSRIVQNLKDFSQLDSSQEWQEVDLHHGLDATLNLMAGELQQKGVPQSWVGNKLALSKKEPWQT